MSQFINETSAACDIVIVGGDFNYRPNQLGYKVIRYNANLDDSWVARVCHCFLPMIYNFDRSFITITILSKPIFLN